MNQQHLVEVLVGKVLEKHNVSSANDLSTTDKFKLKNTILNIQEEVNKFLSSADVEPVTISQEDLSNNRVRTNLINTVEDKDDSHEVKTPRSHSYYDYYDEPYVSVIKRDPTHFVNKKKRKL